MATDYISEAVKAALNTEKRIADTLAGKRAPKSTTEVKTTTNSKEGTKPVDKLNDKSSKTEGTNSGRDTKKRRRAQTAVSLGSNWKKLKLEIDAESAKKGKPEWLKKREAKMKREQERKAREQKKQDKAAAKVVDDTVEHSRFARRAVATRDGKLTRVVALDCEMVEVAGGQDALARVSLVNVHGDVVYDSFVAIEQEITDYRTEFSGVRKEDVEAGKDPREVRAAVAELLKGRILVGHALRNDMRVLALAHPRHLTRDTSMYFRRRHGRPAKSAPKLSTLVATKLGVDEFQKGEHDSAEDARAALALYKKFGSEWEKEIRESREKKRKPRKWKKGNKETNANDRVEN